MTHAVVFGPSSASVFLGGTRLCRAAARPAPPAAARRIAFLASINGSRRLSSSTPSKRALFVVRAEPEEAKRPDERDAPVVFDIPEGIFDGLPPLEDEEIEVWEEGEEYEEEEEEIDLSKGIDVSQYLTQPALSKMDPLGHKAGYVALVGKPNAGKSTLLNQLLGQKISIVTNKPQTTRHKVLGIISEENYQMVLLDTPGVIMKKNNKMEEMMMTSVRKSLADADVAIAIIDASWKPLIALRDLDLPEGLPFAVALNKTDKLMGEADGKQKLAEIVKWFESNTKAEAVITMCAREGRGVDEVQEWAANQLPEARSFYPKDILSEHPERFFVSEIIREKIFMQYQKEVPYSCQVNVVEFKERPGGQKDYVSCQILVERDSQKGILLGAKGSQIKKLGSTARVDIESFLGKGVHLDLHVKVQDDWRENERQLRAMGFKRWK